MTDFGEFWISYSKWSWVNDNFFPSRMFMLYSFAFFIKPMQVPNYTNFWQALWNQGKTKVNWWHFSVHSEVPISFSLVIGPNYSIYNVAMGGLPVLCTMSLLPSQPKPVPIYTPWSTGTSQSKVPCSRTQHATHTGFKLTTLGSWVWCSTAELPMPLM